MTKLISGRVAKVDSANVSVDRYQFIGLSETEPDLGLPAVSGYVLSSDLSGNRIWVDAAAASGSPYFANTSGIANVALTANIANTVLTLSNFTTANLVEGINLYYTNARVLSFITPYLTTANVLESDSNLYYTNARVYAAIEGNLATKANVADLTTSNVSEGSNLYYTNARVISAVLPYLTTSNVVEGSNLYYTNTRVYSNVIATLAGNITIGNATIGNVSVAGSTTFGAGTGGSLTGANLLSASYIQTGNLLATSGNILITGNIIPSIDSTFNFGSLDKQWKDFYLSAESLYVGGQKISGNAQTGLTLVSLTASNITTGNLVVANSLIGNVTGTVSSLSNFSTSNLAEGTNQYFTNARVTANLEQQSVNVFVDVDTTGITTNGILIWNGTSFVAGTIDTGATANIALFANTAGTANVALTANIANTVLSLSNLTTSNLAEGANLYFTNARAVAAFTAGQNIIIEANGRISANVNLEIANLNSTISNLTTNSITEGNNNLYYTNGRVISAVTPLLTTANVIESDSNLYYTNARTRSALSGGTGVSYDNGTGVISIGQNVASTANVTFFNLSVTNNLTVYGGVTTYGANNLSVSDNMIYLNSNSTVSNPDIGFAFNYNDGVYHHGGFFRDASDNGTFKVFENYLPEPDANIFIDTADASFRLANIAATTFFGNVSGTAGSLSNFTTANLAEGTNLYYTNARVNSYIQGNLASKANITDLTTSNVVEGTNLYYTNARVNSFIQGNLVLKANVVDLTTSNVAEGSNLYYTNTRVVSAVTPLLTAANIANFTSTVNATVQPFLTTANVVETSGNLYFTNTRVIFAAIPAVTELTVTTPVFNYNIDQYAGDNPAIYVSAGETIAFNLNVSGSHPFNIRVSDGGSNYNTGLTHIAQDGTVSTESSAQGKVTGKLFWKIPYVLAGNTYVYQCTNHGSMVGSIVIQRPVSTITTDNVTEGSNLYYTNARVLQAITVGTIPGNLAVSGNLIANGLIIRNISVSDSVLSGNITAGGFSGNTIAVDVITSNVWNGLYTANVIETNGNLYYTNARVYSNVIALLPTLAGQNITIEANGRISATTTGTVSLDGLTTSNLAEGINLYYTNARARTAYTAGQNITIDSGTGVITSTAGSTVVNDSDLITVLAATTNYTLSRTVSDAKNILVINEGLIQIPTTDYTVSGTTLTTTTQYPVGSNIEIRYFGIDSTTAGAYSTTLSAVLNTFVANGSNINFPLTATPVSAAYTIVNIDGVSQLTSAYSISGSTLTFTEAPEANANINVRILGGAVGQTFNTRTYTGDGNTTNFSITSGFTENNILVFENGVAQVPTTDYTVNTTTSNVVMAVATAANVSIQIRELGSTTANVLSQILNSDLTTSNIVPKAGNTYNLGSTSAPYNKLYLSGSNSLILGNTTVSVSGNSLIISTAGASTVVGASTSSPNSRILGYNLVFGG